MEKTRRNCSPWPTKSCFKPRKKDATGSSPAYGLFLRSCRSAPHRPSPQFVVTATCSCYGGLGALVGLALYGERGTPRMCVAQMQMQGVSAKHSNSVIPSDGGAYATAREEHRECVWRKCRCKVFPRKCC